MGRSKVRKLFESTDRLFTETLRGGYDDDFPWRAIHRLRKTGHRVVFDKALEWCSSSYWPKRARGAEILAQLGVYKRHICPVWLGRDQSFALLTKLLPNEKEHRVIESQISTLGHLGKAGAVSLIAPYATHPEENVRFAVACAMGSYTEDSVANEILARLMDDPACDVRSWAIFGIGVQSNADSEELRLKFLEHLDDPFLDARMEAAAALGKRRDARLAVPLVRMLKKNGALSGLTEAARELLEMSEDPKAWFEDEYIAAIEAKFPEAR